LRRRLDFDAPHREKNLAVYVLPLLRGERIIAKACAISTPQPKAGAMAEDHAPLTGHPAMDYAEHERTYKLFLKLVKYTVIGAVALLILLAVFLG
jgi:hypothetical protein